MTAPDSDEPLVDFTDLQRRVGSVVVPVAALSLLGAVVDGAIRGLTFALLGRWAGLFVLVSVLVVAVFTAIHALGGAGAAGRRGERLSSPDVGLAPRKFSNPLWSDRAVDPETPPETDLHGPDDETE